MSGRNVNIDYYGVILILRYLVSRETCTKREAEKIAARIAAQYGADLIISL